MAGMLTDWVKSSESSQLLLAEEELILSVTEQIWELLEKKGLTKSDLAEHMGKSRSQVSQVLSGSRNMTLRTLADIAFALGERVSINFEKTQKPKDDWQKVNNIYTNNVLSFPTPINMPASNDWYSLLNKF